MISVGFQTLLKREVNRFMKMWTQTLIPPLISSLLFIFIFGFFVSPMLENLPGGNYIAFFIPGLIMLNVMTSSFSNSAFSLFLLRFLNITGDLLSSPLTYAETVLAMTLGGMVRGLMTGILILGIAFVFVGLPEMNWLLFFVYLALISFIFSSLGLVMGLVAEEFEHIEILNIFIINPLTFLGGIFHSVHSMPEIIQSVSFFNPFFYIIDGFRFVMIGYSEGNLLVTIIIVIGLTVGLASLNMYLFKKGWKLRT